MCGMYSWPTHYAGKERGSLYNCTAFRCNWLGNKWLIYLNLRKFRCFMPLFRGALGPPPPAFAHAGLPHISCIPPIGFSTFSYLSLIKKCNMARKTEFAALKRYWAYVYLGKLGCSEWERTWGIKKTEHIAINQSIITVYPPYIDGMDTLYFSAREKLYFALMLRNNGIFSWK